MEQAMDSPITADQREGCIAELKRDNSRDLSKLKQFLFFICFWALTRLDFWFVTIGEPKAAREAVTIACIALVVAGACFAVSTWAVLHWIAETMRKYAATVFVETDLVNYVLSLPSDVKAYRGRIRAVLTGEWLTFKPERFDARRRAKAIVMRFGTWCRRYHRLSELWPIGGAIYIFGGAIIFSMAAFQWLLSQPDIRQLIEHSQYASYPDISLGLVIIPVAIYGLLAAVLLGRCIGTRSALIEYFQAEAARLKSASVAADKAARARRAGCRSGGETFARVE